MIDQSLRFIAQFPTLKNCLIVADAWYSKGKIIKTLAKKQKIRLISRVAHNAAARRPYIPPLFPQKKRGRKPKYEGARIKLCELFKGELQPFKVKEIEGNSHY